MTINPHPITIAAAVSQRQEDFLDQADAERLLDRAARRAGDPGPTSLSASTLVARARGWRPLAGAPASGGGHRSGLLPRLAPRLIR